MATKTAIFQEYAARYWKGSKQKKHELLTHLCFVTGMHRKAAIRKFAVLQRYDPAYVRHRGRETVYTSDVTVALRSVWETASQICGELLHPVVSDYVRILVRDHLSTSKLLAMSEATMKRRIAGFVRQTVPHHGMGTTKPSALKMIVPIFIGLPGVDRITRKLYDEKRQHDNGKKITPFR